MSMHIDECYSLWASIHVAAVTRVTSKAHGPCAMLKDPVSRVRFTVVCDLSDVVDC